MMGERGMWYKQHFFEWAAKVPLIVNYPKKFKPASIKENVSLVDLLPTVLESANADKTLSSKLDGQSLYGAMTQSDQGALSDTAISEFAADGSTGPSRMVKHGSWKYMYLEGQDELLYNLDDDPNELTNRINDVSAKDVAAHLRGIALKDWDPDQWRQIIAEDQQRRLFVHNVTGGEPTYVPIIREGDEHRYIRNAGAADTKARARLPYVSPATPDLI